MAEPLPSSCVFLTGPTAGGKSAVGLVLAPLLGAEIVALDSMTLYRGMDIGTAKPSADDRAAVAHHLIDLLDPAEEFSQAEYATAARRAVDDILARGKTPLFVGGAPLYLKTLLRGMFEGPPPDWEFRRSLADEARRESPDWLHRRVAEFDPAAAAKLHPNDERRLIRAWEVYRATGTPISEHQRHFDRPNESVRGRVFQLVRPRDELCRRIDARVEAMFAAGLVDEVRRLAAPPRSLGRTARKALGYREVLEFLESPAPGGLSVVVDAVRTHTRQFAKRQLTWFRSLPECETVPIAGEPDPLRIAQSLYARLCRAT